MKNTSIQQKIVWIIMLVSTSSLFLAATFFLSYDLVSYRNKVVHEYVKLADIIGTYNDASVALMQREATQSNLYDILRSDIHVKQAAIFDLENQLFSLYDLEVYQQKNAEGPLPVAKVVAAAQRTPGYQQDMVDFDFWGNSLQIYTTIKDGETVVNTVYLQVALTEFYSIVYRYVAIYIIFFVCALFFSYFLSTRLQGLISKPILDLAEVAKKITSQKDYSIRLKHKQSEESEIKILISAFNEMLSEIELQNESLITAKEEAEYLAKTKQEFLANMSHEIRTPMNGVIGVADLLSETTLSEQQKKYLNIIRSSADNLLVIINDILDLSKIASGKLTLEQNAFYLMNVIETVVASCLPKLKKKNLEIDVQVDESLPQTLIGDSVRLNQILLNLFSNAIKFTIKGKVTIGASLVRETTEEITIRFFVKDTGIGIPRSKYDAIFGSFTQASNDTTRKYGGTGLGLAITKQLVELHGGKIFLESEVGRGSTFSCEITLLKNKEEQLVDAVAEEVKVMDNLWQSALEQPGTEISEVDLKVLLVEDNEVNQMLVQTLLKQWDYACVLARNGREALEKLRQEDFDIVLMDLHMPEMDGYDATRHIRKFEGYKAEVPIIAMTASALKDEAVRCLEAGMNDYISKPFNKNDLYEKLSHYTREHSS
ncbi:response regulator [Algivirga pacifica]